MLSNSLDTATAEISTNSSPYCLARSGRLIVSSGLSRRLPSSCIMFSPHNFLFWGDADSKFYPKFLEIAAPPSTKIQEVGRLDAVVMLRAMRRLWNHSDHSEEIRRGPLYGCPRGHVRAPAPVLPRLSPLAPTSSPRLSWSSGVP